MRCTSKKDLEVHHKRRDGGNDLNNAKVLCHECHVTTSTYGTDGKSPEPFSEITKQLAKVIAGNQCECNKVTCNNH